MWVRVGNLQSPKEWLCSNILDQLYSFNLWTVITLISNYSYRLSCQCLHVRLFTQSSHVCMHMYVGCILSSKWVIGICRSMAVGRWMAECFAATTQSKHSAHSVVQSGKEVTYTNFLSLPFAFHFQNTLALKTLPHTHTLPTTHTHVHVHKHTHRQTHTLDKPMVEFWIRVELVSPQCEAD